MLRFQFIPDVVQLTTTNHNHTHHELLDDEIKEVHEISEWSLVPWEKKDASADDIGTPS